MNIKKELTKRGWGADDALSRGEVVRFTQDNEEGLGFYLEENTRDCDRYMTAIVGATIGIKGRDRYVGIIFDWEALPDNQDFFTKEEVAKRLEEVAKRLKELKEEAEEITKK
jgi:hypothetical protein